MVHCLLWDTRDEPDCMTAQYKSSLQFCSIAVATQCSLARAYTLDPAIKASFSHRILIVTRKLVKHFPGLFLCNTNLKKIFGRVCNQTNNINDCSIKPFLYNTRVLRTHTQCAVDILLMCQFVWTDAKYRIYSCTTKNKRECDVAW